MKISLNWIKELVNFNSPVEKLIEDLSMKGFPVEEVLKKEDDIIIDIEVTPNRPDCLGHIGIAREISAIYDIPLKKVRTNYRETEEAVENVVNIEILNPDLCLRYSGILIRDFKVTESPLWLKKRLEYLGVRSINVAVDLTNYVLLLTGHPIHAFDLEKIEERKILIRRAISGEKLITLDGVERILDDETLVIADGKKPLAIAGIIGGENSGISETTKDIFIESAYFNPISIRRTSKKLNFITEASYRFERGTDWEFPPIAAKICGSLFWKFGGKISKGVIDVYPGGIPERKVILRKEKLQELTGIPIPDSFVKKTLTKLGFNLTKIDKGKWNVIVPSRRNDATHEADLIEEVIRYFGYEKIPIELPATIESEIYIGERRNKVKKIREILFEEGYDEVINFSFINPHNEDFLNGDPIFLKNPISSKLSQMRRSLIPSLLESISLNMSRGIDGVKIFEIGNVYRKENEKIVEKLFLGVAASGYIQDKSWIEKEKFFDVFHLKGSIFHLLENLGIKNIKFEKSSENIYEQNSSLNIIISNEKVGSLGILNDSVLKKFQIEKKTFYSELNLDKILDEEHKFEFEPISRFPSTTRDISFLVDKKIPYSKIEETILSLEINELERFYLWDVFSGGNIPPEKVSMTMSFVYRSADRTLTDGEVNLLHMELIKKLKEKIDIKLR